LLHDSGFRRARAEQLKCMLGNVMRSSQRNCNLGTDKLTSKGCTASWPMSCVHSTRCFSI
jgi:hypothetical protein